MGGGGGSGGNAEGGGATGGSAAGGDGGGPGAGGLGGGGAGPGSGGAGGAAGSKGELELCTVGECAPSLVCKEMVKGGPSRCAASCSNNTQCPQGGRCVDDGGGGRCVGHDTGRGCTLASQCNFACITGPNYCTNECQTGFDCPNGYGCMEVSNVDVCVKLEAVCDGGANAACVVQAACDTTDPNLTIWGCTSACDSAIDCPQRAAPLNANAPWTCDGLCRRPADIYGPLPGGSNPTEWHCDAGFNGVNMCNDGQHIDFVGFTIPAPPAPIDCNSNFTTTGAANDSCVNSCLFDGDCPHDFSCVAVGAAMGERIGLCLPSGTLEPGAACTNNTQCAFGYCVDNVCSRDCTVDGLCPGGTTTCVNGGSVAVEGMAFRRCE